jgi:hypothetical protein
MYQSYQLWQENVDSAARPLCHHFGHTLVAALSNTHTHKFHWSEISNGVQFIPATADPLLVPGLYIYRHLSPLSNSTEWLNVLIQNQEKFNAPSNVVPTPDLKYRFETSYTPIVKKNSFQRVYKYGKKLPTYHKFLEIIYISHCHEAELLRTVHVVICQTAIFI